MDPYEHKTQVCFWLPESMEKAIRDGRRKVNLSYEIRKLIELGLEYKKLNLT